MTFTAEDFKDKYLLGGRKYNPSSDKTLFDQISNDCFTIIFSSTFDDNSAIAKADQHIRQRFESAKTGESLSATLWFNGRVVKIYPEQIKT